jgi:hypothetical protein
MGAVHFLRNKMYKRVAIPAVRALWPAFIIIPISVSSVSHRPSLIDAPSSAKNGAVAWVGSTAISQSDLDTALRDVAVDLQPVNHEGTRREVLDKLIAEELLFQYGMAHQIYQTDFYLRLRVVRRMLSFACASSPSAAGGSGATPGSDECLKRGDTDARRSIDEYVRWLRARATIRVQTPP